MNLKNLFVSKPTNELIKKAFQIGGTTKAKTSILRFGTKRIQDGLKTDARRFHQNTLVVLWKVTLSSYSQLVSSFLFHPDHLSRFHFAITFQSASPFVI